MKYSKKAFCFAVGALIAVLSIKSSPVEFHCDIPVSVFQESEEVRNNTRFEVVSGMDSSDSTDHKKWVHGMVILDGHEDAVRLVNADTKLDLINETPAGELLEEFDNEDNSVSDSLGASEFVSDSDINSNDDAYPSDFLGRFKIPEVGVDVACYYSHAQATVDASDSAAYFYSSGHVVIGDHNYQGFEAIKACRVGTSATMHSISGTVTYTCIDVIQGHNTGSTLTDGDYVSIANLYPGALVCYTCNDNPSNITIVFFASDTIGNEVSGESESSIQKSEEPKVHGSCVEHIWGDWEVAWEVRNEEGDFGWEKRICLVCDEEEWVQMVFEDDESKSEEVESETTEPKEMDAEETETEATDPNETESNGTGPWVTESEETEPEEPDSQESVPGVNSSDEADSEDLECTGSQSEGIESAETLPEETKCST